MSTTLTDSAAVLAIAILRARQEATAASAAIPLGVEHLDEASDAADVAATLARAEQLALALWEILRTLDPTAPPLPEDAATLGRELDALAAHEAVRRQLDDAAVAAFDANPEEHGHPTPDDITRARIQRRRDRRAEPGSPTCGVCGEGPLMSPINDEPVCACPKPAPPRAAW